MVAGLRFICFAAIYAFFPLVQGRNSHSRGSHCSRHSHSCVTSDSGSTPTTAADTTAAAQTTAAGADNTSKDSPSTTSTGAASSSSTSSGSFWKPTAGTTWQIDISESGVDASLDVPVYDIDLFGNTADQISTLKSAGKKVICYFSAGSYENWRPDKGEFQSSDLGDTLDGWPNEKWLNTKSDNVRKIMMERLDMAVTKKCDGVDPDNVDGYDNTNGLGLTEADAIDYVNFLADQAHSRGLSIGLKNAGGIISGVIDNMEWSVNEQCAQYSECSTYAPFITAGKPVFHIEYPKGDDTNNNDSVASSTASKLCSSSGSTNFSTVLKNIDLDAWVQFCDSSSGPNNSDSDGFAPKTMGYSFAVISSSLVAFFFLHINQNW